MQYFFEVYGTLPRAGPGDDRSTDKAFKMVPNMPTRPRDILDIGCGPGMQTLELARLSKDNITALGVLDAAQKEIDGFKKNSDYFGYEFFVARKI